MSKKPIIGILSSVNQKADGIVSVYSTNENYIEQVLKAGGIPVQIPVVSKTLYDDLNMYIDMCDGFILPGGGDFDPTWYGEKTLPGLEPVYEALDMDIQRITLALVRKIVSSKKPVIGICLGMQLLNIAFGGTLFQDINSQLSTDISHSNDTKCKEDRSKGIHAVKLSENSLVRSFADADEIMVNSFHHQSVREVAPGFNVTAKSSDGIIEAIEHENGKVIGFQWHPENMAAASVKEAEKAFNWLVDTAGKQDKMIIFDLDGTLWDSAADVAESWNIVIREAKEELAKGDDSDREFLSKLPGELNAQDIQNVMGKTMSEIAIALMPEADPERRSVLFKKCETFEVDYLMERGAKVYEGAEETFKKLIEMGYKLTIVSNCQTDYVKSFLVSMNMSRYFADYEEWGRTLKIKGENIKLIMERNGITLDNAVYVGDTQGDFDATKYAGLPFIWASYGFGNVPLADAVLKNIKELPDVVSKFI